MLSASTYCYCHTFSSTTAFKTALKTHPFKIYYCYSVSNLYPLQHVLILLQLTAVVCTSCRCCCLPCMVWITCICFRHFPLVVSRLECLDLISVQPTELCIVCEISGSHFTKISLLLLYPHHSYLTGGWSRWEARGSRPRRPCSSHTWSTLTAWVWRSCSSTPSRQRTWTPAQSSTSTSCCLAAPPCTRAFRHAWSARSSSCTWSGCWRGTLPGCL